MLAGDSTTRDEVSALGRGLALLRVLADAGVPLSNKELADRCGIPKATVSRLTATLQSAGFLRLSADERFALGPANLLLGSAFLRSYDFRQEARLHLAELAEAAGANVHLGVREGLDILLIDTLRPRSAMIVSRMDVGARMAIATSAVGRAYYASLPPDRQAALQEDIRAASGEQWSQVQARLEAALQEHALHGFCSSFGEWHPEIHAVGFSLRGARGELYGVSVGGPAYLLTRELLMGHVGPRLLQTRRAIEGEAGLA
ncbi:MAG: IclR family transcriptional regulator [Ramlibacter sp.]|uniref:IclR family transcriptional regulator n=1 Tax=Ramlibacter sp. TaxID=1917967 RepID=UPI00262FDEAC|nr:IclR family transcriptional regulator [Ramlibacter sp.]MDB5752153.1 IclR family transcriptional regulator [Ramlibacter sp.]